MTNQVEFEFFSSIYPKDTFSVLRFSGREGLSDLYRFEIELYAEDPDIELEPLLERPCTFRMTVGGSSRDIQGVLSDIEALNQISGYTVYRAVLVPRLWLLSLYYANEVYLGRTVPEILRAVLEEGGLSSADSDIRLQRDYREWPFRCQYNETHLNFISRLMEREGIYYYFAPGDDAEKLILCDHRTHQDDMERPELDYAAAVGMDSAGLGDHVHALVSRHQRMPQEVILRDYNDESPSVDITGRASVDSNGRGIVNVFGQNIISPDEGAELAGIRAEEMLARKTVYHGESTVARLCPGFHFRLRGHFRKGCNRAYTVTALEHRGCDPRALAALPEADRRDAPAYENRFTAIPSDTQFRPPQRAPRPELHGSMNAAITAEGDGQYAELDDEGRYHVLLPFDREVDHEGKSSHWIRMAQAYAGENEGMHFPLRKGARVLLSFIGGDPDRPVITGAMPNAAQPSIVNATNQTNNLIRTAAGNRIEMEDQQGRNRIKFHTGDDNSYMHLGAPNHAGDGWVVVTRGIERREILGGQNIMVRATSTALDGKSDTTTGVATGGSHLAGATSDDSLVSAWPYSFHERDQDGGKSSSAALTEAQEWSGKYLINRRVGPYYEYTSGNTYSFGGSRDFSYGNAFEVAVPDDGSDPSTLVSGLLSVGPPKGISKVSTSDPKLSSSTSVTTANQSATDRSSAWANFCNNDALVSIRWQDEVEYAVGRSYSFGDTAEYSFGNGYTEEYMAEDAEIDKKGEHELVDKGGPGWTSISAEKVTSLAAGSTWVEKKWGNSYEYTHGDSVAVTVGDEESHAYGDTYEFTYGGAHEESVYAGSGQRVLWNRTANGIETEIRNHRDSGVLLHASTSNWVGGHNEASFDFAPASSASFNAAFQVSAEVQVGGTMAVGAHIGLVGEINAFLGFKMDISTAPGWALEVDDDGWKFGGPGVETQGNKAINAAIEQLKLLQSSLAFCQGNAEIKQLLIGIHNGVQLHC